MGCHECEPHTRTCLTRWISLGGLTTCRPCFGSSKAEGQPPTSRVSGINHVVRRGLPPSNSSRRLPLPGCGGRVPWVSGGSPFTRTDGTVGCVSHGRSGRPKLPRTPSTASTSRSPRQSAYEQAEALQDHWGCGGPARGAGRRIATSTLTASPAATDNRGGDSRARDLAEARIIGTGTRARGIDISSPWRPLSRLFCLARGGCLVVGIRDVVEVIRQRKVCVAGDRGCFLLGFRDDVQAAPAIEREGARKGQSRPPGVTWFDHRRASMSQISHPAQSTNRDACA